MRGCPPVDGGAGVGAACGRLLAFSRAASGVRIVVVVIIFNFIVTADTLTTIGIDSAWPLIGLGGGWEQQLKNSKWLLGGCGCCRLCGPWGLLRRPGGCWRRVEWGLGFLCHQQHQVSRLQHQPGR